MSYAGAKSIHALNISLTGQITGSATVYLLINEKPYKSKTIEGKVYATWAGGWYDDEAVFVYIPKNVILRRLKINYGYESL